MKLNNSTVSANGGVKNQIDHLLINRQGRCLETRVIRGADANGDHYMIKIRIRICKSTFKNKSKVRPNLNVERLKKR